MFTVGLTLAVQAGVRSTVIMRPDGPLSERFIGTLTRHHLREILASLMKNFNLQDIFRHSSVVME